MVRSVGVGAVCEPLLAGVEADASIRKRVRRTLDELELVQQLDEIRARGGDGLGRSHLLPLRCGRSEVRKGVSRIRD